MTGSEIEQCLAQLGATLEAARSRIRPKMSQTSAAQLAGLKSHVSVSRIETGLPTNTDTLVALADAVGLEVVLRPKGTQIVRLELPPDAAIQTVTDDDEAA